MASDGNGTGGSEAGLVEGDKTILLLQNIDQACVEHEQLEAPRSVSLKAEEPDRPHSCEADRSEDVQDPLTVLQNLQVQVQPTLQTLNKSDLQAEGNSPQERPKDKGDCTSCEGGSGERGNENETEFVVESSVLLGNTPDISQMDIDEDDARAASSALLDMASSQERRRKSRSEQTYHRNEVIQW